MQIDKNQIIDLLKSRGDHDKAAQAESELPDQVDPQGDAGLLEKLGINPQELLGNLPGASVASWAAWVGEADSPDAGVPSGL